jgi:hypothetical protein
MGQYLLNLDTGTDGRTDGQKEEGISSHSRFSQVAFGTCFKIFSLIFLTWVQIVKRIARV